MSGCPRSTSARNSSIQQTDFFFEPVQFHLQPPNLFVQRVAGSFPVPPFATVHEELRKLFQRTLPPFRNLDGMHLELRTQLTQRLLAAHRLDRNPRFELRTILLSRRRHRPLLCQRLRRNLTLLPGLKSGDHYSLNHYVILNARHLKRTLSYYFRYYHESRTHLSLDKQCPFPREALKFGKIVAIPQLGGLHHRYQRIAA